MESYSTRVIAHVNNHNARPVLISKLVPHFATLPLAKNLDGKPQQTVGPITW